jgi:eukaryotic-like serine/threonine-protein kinase
MLQGDEQIGRYKIRSLLGVGGMGKVFLAEDVELKRPVAVKVLPFDVSGDVERNRRFVQEARAASALNHPNILTIHEIGEANGSRFIASEFIKGETLRKRLQGATLDVLQTLDIGIQTASALCAAHEAKIIHRDIKPENVMLRDDGLVKVLDFGLAKLVEKAAEILDTQAATQELVQTNPGVVLGTVAYMSPEQARGLQVDARTDVWSLGVMLYEMLTGKLPFEGNTTSDYLAAILKTEPVPLSRLNPHVPAELERIINKTLTKDCEERYQTAKDLLIDLKRLKKQLELNAELERTASANKETVPQTLTTAQTINSSNENKNYKLTLLAALLVLMITGAGLSYWFYFKDIVAAKQIDSIAVMPFVNESGNADTEYLSDGMTDSLIGSLMLVPKLNVKARSSVFRYKGKDLDAQTIGRELKVQAVLNGRIVQRGEQLILSVELVDAATENVLWKENYNRTMANLVYLQSDIARDVSQKLKMKLSGTDERRVVRNYTENAEAYRLYLQGRYFWNKRRITEMGKAINYFQQAIAFDPNYALAYAGLADAVAQPSEVVPHLEREQKAREAALKALSLDNDLAEAHTALAHILTRYNLDFAGAERHLNRALELNPKWADIYQRYGELYSFQGRHDEAVAKLRQGLEIEPFNLPLNTALGGALTSARRYDEAIVQLKKAVELDPNHRNAYIALVTVYTQKGMYAEAAENRVMALKVGNQDEWANSVRDGFAKDGWLGVVRAELERFERLGYLADRLPHYNKAHLLAFLGEKDKAFAALDESVKAREQPALVGLKTDPRFDSLRDDPRFREIMRRAGFPN